MLLFWCYVTLQGRILLGNHLTEYSLVLYFTKAEAHYSTTQVSPWSLAVEGSPCVEGDVSCFRAPPLTMSWCMLWTCMATESELLQRGATDTRDQRWTKSMAIISLSLSLSLSEVKLRCVLFQSSSCMWRKWWFISLSQDRLCTHQILPGLSRWESEREIIWLTRIPCRHVVHLLVKTRFLIGLVNWFNLLSAEA